MRKQKKKRVVLPPPGPQIEFRGNRQAIVEGCRNILEYEPETVKLDVGCYNIRMNGTGLKLRSMSDRCVMIEGCLSGLDFCC